MYAAVHSPAFYDSTLGKTFVAWEAWAGGGRAEQVTALDHSTGYFSDIEGMGRSFLVDDDHGNPVIALDHENHLHAFYGAHVSDMRHSSTRWPWDGAALDGSKWEVRANIAGNHTYPHPVMVGSTMYLFIRDYGATDNYSLGLMKTTALADGVATWGSNVSIVSFGNDTRVYQGTAVLVGTKIHFVCSKADGADTIREHVYYFVYDTVNGDLENHDGSVSTASGSLPVLLTAANASYRIFTHSGGNGGYIPVLAFDTNGDPFVAFSDGTGSTYSWKVMKRSAGAWGSPETVGNTASRFSGSAIGALASGQMELFWRDGGVKRKVRSSGGVWGAEQMILADESLNIGNINAVRNAHANARVTFAEEAADDTDATAATGSRRIYLWGDGGLIVYNQAPVSAINTTADGVELREDGFAELREDDSDELREAAA